MSTTQPYDYDEILDGESVDLMNEIPAWGFSLLVHVGIVLLLGLFSFTQIVQDRRFSLTTIQEEEVLPEEYKIDTAIVPDMGSDSDANINGPSLAAAAKSGTDTHREMERRLENKLIQPDEPLQETLPDPSEAELVENFTAVGSTEHTGGTKGAIDRLTREIEGSLREKRSLVVWLFDESLSQVERREAIADRFENVYRQLGARDLLEDKSLKTCVASFGKGFHVHTPDPVDDVTEVVKAIRTIPADETGFENVFTAIRMSYRRWASYRRKSRRNMMIIVVTDERGDDYNQLESLISELSRADVKTYCVGNASPFGREKGYIRYTWTQDNETFTEDISVDQGPETVAAERLQLPFWTGGGRGLGRMSSGFGPYALTRLCVETGGVFFLAEDALGRKFDYAVMRNYLPDYRPIANYQRQLKHNKAKFALVQAAQQAMVNSVPTPRFVFRALNDTELRVAITEAQKPLAEVEYHLSAMASLLEAGEEDRAQLDSARWKAAFDLAMGRVLALRARAYGYNAMLADMKSAPKTFKKEGNNQWRLIPSDELTSGPVAKKLTKKANEYLTRVIDEHPGTPWEMLASIELSEPMGWAWKEGFIKVATNNNMGRNNNNNNQVLLADDEVRERRKREERTKIREMSRPKL